METVTKETDSVKTTANNAQSTETDGGIDDLLKFLEGDSTANTSKLDATEPKEGIDDSGSDDSSEKPSSHSGRSTTPSEEDEAPYTDREKKLLERIEQLTGEKLERGTPKESSSDSQQFEPQ